MTADEPSRSLRVAGLSRPSGAAEATRGEMAMICPETQTGQRLRKTARLLNSVAEAAWTNGTSITGQVGTTPHRYRRVPRLPRNARCAGLRRSTGRTPACDIAANLAEAANTLGVISQAVRKPDTERLAKRGSSLARSTLALARQSNLEKTGILVQWSRPRRAMCLLS